MGLKKTNYEIKELGITLPEAYAMVKDLEIKGTEAVAKIAVQQSRDFAMSKTPIASATVRFTVNRNENPYETAYKIAKGTTTARRYNPKTKLVELAEVPMPFNGWEDDIVISNEGDVYEQL